MPGQIILDGGSAPTEPPQVAGITLPSDFKLVAVDAQLEPIQSNKFHAQKVGQPLKPQDPPAPLGVLSRLKGTFTGPGFNVIFRPESSATPTQFNTATVGPNDNTLELNLTQETWSFADALGDVPNRGLFAQPDIVLNGIPYVQTVKNVTNPESGGRDAPKPLDIHFEPGLFMHVPKSTNPNIGPTISRMASIPHGTVINLQGVAPDPKQESNGPPVIPDIDITPFAIGDISARFNGVFPSLVLDNPNTLRIPQDLNQFNKKQTITQRILSNPNQLLKDANAKNKILKHISFKLSSDRDTVVKSGGGTANITFLEGDNATPNARAAKVESTFWISTVEYTVKFKEQRPSRSQPGMMENVLTPPGAQEPAFIVTNQFVPADKSFKITGTQVQYSQQIILDFFNISWPHVSVATLSPVDTQIKFSDLKEVKP